MVTSPRVNSAIHLSSRRSLPCTRTMKITDVRVVLHERPSPATVGPPVLPLGVVSVITDEGLQGHTFIGGPSAEIGPALIKQVKPMLVGSDPLDVGRIWSMLGNRRLHPTIQGTVDVTLWDIAGKAAGLPVHRLLGTVRQGSGVSVHMG